jgi:hypothetical protein
MRCLMIARAPLRDARIGAFSHPIGGRILGLSQPSYVAMRDPGLRDEIASATMLSARCDTASSNSKVGIRAKTYGCGCRRDRDARPSWQLASLRRPCPSRTRRATCTVRANAPTGRKAVRSPRDSRQALRTCTVRRHRIPKIGLCLEARYKFRVSPSSLPLFSPN